MQPVNLAAWQSRGFYSVGSSNRTQILLNVPATDFGSALLTDCELLLDHAAEHQVSLWKNINTHEWLSPAWMGVTFYYWSYFLAQAFTRLLGNSAWFLSKEIARDFQRLAPAGSAAAGAGCFKLKCGNTLSITDREVILRRSNSRVHEAAWQVFFESCSTRLALLPADPEQRTEALIYGNIANSATKLGSDWPSAFRNAINYRPGFAYCAVRRATVLRSFTYLQEPFSHNFLDILGRFEHSLDDVRDSDSIIRKPQKVSELLVDLTFILHSLVHELYEELIERHGLDSRWRNKRTHFLKINGLIQDANTWPV